MQDKNQIANETTEFYEKKKLELKQAYLNMDIDKCKNIILAIDPVEKIYFIEIASKLNDLELLYHLYSVLLDFEDEKLLNIYYKCREIISKTHKNAVLLNFFWGLVLIKFSLEFNFYDKSLSDNFNGEEEDLIHAMENLVDDYKKEIPAAVLYIDRYLMFNNILEKKDDQNENTVLHIAAKQGNENIINIILNKNIRLLFTKNKHKQTVIDLLIIHHFPQIMMNIVDNNYQVDKKIIVQHIPQIMMNIVDNNYQVVKKIIVQQILFSAARYANIQLIDFAINKGANYSVVNTSNDFKVNLVEAALYSNNIECVKHVIEKVKVLINYPISPKIFSEVVLNNEIKNYMFARQNQEIDGLITKISLNYSTLNTINFKNIDRNLSPEQIDKLSIAVEQNTHLKKVTLPLFIQNGMDINSVINQLISKILSSNSSILEFDFCPYTDFDYMLKEKINRILYRNSKYQKIYLELNNLLDNYKNVFSCTENRLSELRMKLFLFKENIINLTKDYPSWMGSKILRALYQRSEIIYFHLASLETMVVSVFLDFLKITLNKELLFKHFHCNNFYDDSIIRIEYILNNSTEQWFKTIQEKNQFIILLYHYYYNFPLDERATKAKYMTNILNKYFNNSQQQIAENYSENDLALKLNININSNSNSNLDTIFNRLISKLENRLKAKDNNIFIPNGIFPLPIIPNFQIVAPTNQPMYASMPGSFWENRTIAPTHVVPATITATTTSTSTSTLTSRTPSNGYHMENNI